MLAATLVTLAYALFGPAVLVLVPVDSSPGMPTLGTTVVCAGGDSASPSGPLVIPPGGKGATAREPKAKLSGTRLPRSGLPRSGSEPAAAAADTAGPAKEPAATTSGPASMAMPRSTRII